MNRIDRKFKELKTKRKKAFIAFITAGDPDLATTEKLVLGFEQAGVDVVELGVPFSDPLADGPTIQAASQRALGNKTNLEKIFEAVKRIRRRSSVPIALMTYYNPVFRYGEARFISRAKQCGVDGVIIPDLPPEEALDLRRAAQEAKIATVFFVAPTTTALRMKRIVAAATGFVYYVSMTGVTGTNKGFAKENAAKIRAAKRMTQKPVCVGFGVTTPADVRSIAKIADGVIVGSAIVRKIARNQGNKNLVRNVTAFVRTLTREL
ncbi:MAG TPA: tryptophan synthase subunit alpha [Candidatus Omnitrophota bacterium]|nr:tryptophan synthase subunit alpha [Candidatus Omnitrophota bacterium]